MEPEDGGSIGEREEDNAETRLVDIILRATGAGVDGLRAAAQRVAFTRHQSLSSLS
jgi:hypothetical protein